MAVPGRGGGAANFLPPPPPTHPFFHFLPKIKGKRMEYGSVTDFKDVLESINLPFNCLVINSFIFATFMFDGVLIRQGEIRGWSLLRHIVKY